MDITQGYYKAQIEDYKNSEMEVQANLPHDPAAEKTLFKLALHDLQNGLDRDIIGIEIGVLNGETSAALLNISESISLIGIDPIIPDSMETSLIGSIELIEQNTKFAGDRWDFVQDYSTNQVDKCPDDSMDFIFIDGDHTYEAVRTDYELYFPKIKKGGLIFFHDSRMNRGGANFHVGSSAFVDEVIASIDAHNLELIGEAFSLTCFKKK